MIRYKRQERDKKETCRCLSEETGLQSRKRRRKIKARAAVPPAGKVIRMEVKAAQERTIQMKVRMIQKRKIPEKAAQE